MASTRNINTPSDYCLQQRSYKDSLKYNEYVNSQVGRAYITMLYLVWKLCRGSFFEKFSRN